MKSFVVGALFICFTYTASADGGRVPNALEAIKAAQEKWGAMNLKNYAYSVHSGGAFGGEMHTIAVSNGKCHVLHSYRVFEETREIYIDSAEKKKVCSESMIDELMRSLRFYLEEKQFYCDSLKVDPKYGFITEADIDTDLLTDQVWYFEVKEFRAGK